MVFKALVADRLIYKKYVEVLNSLFRLTERELDVFATLLRIHMEWGKDTPKNIIDARSRKQVMQEVLVNKNNLSNYIGELKKQKIVVYNEDRNGWIINPSLVPVLEDNTFIVNFIISKKNE
jgi:hypothetical protein